MAGLSTKAIKTRIKSMQSTRQITKAMELVAASKLRSAQAKAISSRPYFYKEFAEKYGTTPKNYRMQHRKDENVNNME